MPAMKWPAYRIHVLPAPPAARGLGLTLDQCLGQWLSHGS